MLKKEKIRLLLRLLTKQVKSIKSRIVFRVGTIHYVINTQLAATKSAESSFVLNISLII